MATRSFHSSAAQRTFAAARSSALIGRQPASDFLFIASDYKPLPGGIAAYVDNLARGLRSVGSNAKVLAVIGPEEKDRKKFLSEYEEWVIPFPALKDERPQSWVGDKFVSLLEIARCLWPNAGHLLERTILFQPSSHSILDLADVLAAERPGMIIFGHLDRRLYPFALALLELGLPYGILAHDFEVYRHPAYRVNDRIVRGKMIYGARWLAANSHHTRDLIKMWGVSDDRILITHPPVSDQVMRESGQTCPRPGTSEFRLATVCRLVKIKGVDVVLRALKILKDKGVPFQYRIAGDGGDRKSLEVLAGELGLKEEVRFLGYIGDGEKWDELRKADVFVMASRVNPRLSHEGFGLAFLEAAAFGVPGIGSRAGGIVDAVIHGETGLLVPQDSPEELARALIFLYENPEKREEMGRAARERARTHFSPGAISRRFREEVLKRM